jgi:hypothetical protein
MYARHCQYTEIGVLDPEGFGADPDLRIHTTGDRFRSVSYSFLTVGMVYLHQSVMIESYLKVTMLYCRNQVFSLIFAYR